MQKTPLYIRSNSTFLMKNQYSKSLHGVFYLAFYDKIHAFFAEQLFQLIINMNKKTTYISLFSSAGVGCYGFKTNGFECVATNELLEKRLKIQKYNQKCRFDSGYIAGDITLPETQAKLFAEIRRWNTEIDVVIATPPCQGMSVANHKKNNEMARNSLVVESIKIVREVQPKFFIFENVKAFLNTPCTDTDHQEKPIEEAIWSNLGGHYNILSNVLNFKDYGANSSRTRTLVIGVRKDIHHITPYDIFPKQTPPKTLRTLLADLPPLMQMGEISDDDIYHSYREFDRRMLPWIAQLKEGESAFQNTDPARIPHQIKNGEIIYNQNKNGDKYARWFLDREGPCIHTRNDILASQNTIHPTENRVFSVRELMRMMSIPPSFKWTAQDEKQLNALSFDEKKTFLKKEELNIRHCIGESVPTAVLANVAQNIQAALQQSELSMTEIQNLIKRENLSLADNLYRFIEQHFDTYPFSRLLQIAEYANAARSETAAYFTRIDIAFGLVNALPDFKKKKNLRILEPSVGIGNFIPLLAKKYADKEKVIFDLVDIDSNSLNLLSLLLKKLNLGSKFEFNIIHQDFLTATLPENYDLVIGNPPYGKVKASDKNLALYRKNATNKDTQNIFSFFIDKALTLSKTVALVVPKSVINAPEFQITRQQLITANINRIIDYGEKAFKGVKIETIAFIADQTDKDNQHITIESHIQETLIQNCKNYFFSDNFPYWLIYRNSEFDQIAQKLEFNVFQSFRDRQITKAHTQNSGNVRVLKSRNIGNNEIIDIEGYDSYVDSVAPFSVGKFINRKNVVMIPNLTYKPRAAFLPENSIADGSVALLTMKKHEKILTQRDLAYYATPEFEQFYRVARNYGSRSMNIDNHSVFFFGLLKD